MATDRVALRSLVARALAAMAVSFMAQACGVSGTGAESQAACVAGATQECFCPGGGRGVQVCAAGGARWEECTGCQVASGDAVTAGPCAGIACGGHGTCEVLNGNARCVCTTGWKPSGLDCIPDGQPPQQAGCRAMEIEPGQVVCLEDDSLYDAATGVSVDYGLPTENLKPLVDHRSEYMDSLSPNVSNQKGCGWCVAHAITHSIEALQAKASWIAGSNSPAELVSEPHLWSAGGKSVDDCKGGWVIPTGLATAKAHRLVPLSIWPYSGENDVPTTTTTLPNDVLQSEGKFQIKDAMGVDAASVASLKAAIAAGHNVVYSVPVFQTLGWSSFKSGNRWKNGDIEVTAPSSSESLCTSKTKLEDLGGCRCTSSEDCPSKIVGGNSVQLSCKHKRCADGNHAILIVGYDDANGGWFTFKNSWGKSWGDGGFGRLTYGYIEGFGNGGAYPTGLAGCDSHDSTRCSEGNIHWVDSCGKIESDIAKQCKSGCSGENTYCDGENCAPKDKKACFGGDLYWYDSCGNIGEQAQDCAWNEQCQGSACVCVPQCSGKECGDNTCGGVCNACPNGKSCDKNDKCQQNIVPCPSDCSGHGSCEGTTGACTCYMGFAGASCNGCASGYGGYPVCKKTCTNDCSGNGTCNDGTCNCDAGYSGTSCGTCGVGYTGYPDCKKTCPGGCNTHGTCNDGTCSCYTGFSGTSCSSCAPGYAGYPVCEKSCPADCNGYGSCSNGTCSCDPGYSGTSCGTCASGYSGYPICEKTCTNDCSGHGGCNGGTCSCTAGYSGTSCNACASGYSGYPNCTKSCPNDCSGNGSCNAGTCSCYTGYSGTSCNTCASGYSGYPTCTKTCPSDCNGHGTCSNGTCSCYSSYAGSSCGSCASGYENYPSCTKIPTCSVSTYWTPTTVSAQQTINVSGTNVTVKVEVKAASSGSGLQARVCKTSGTFSSNVYLELNTCWINPCPFGSIQQELATAGSTCSPWTDVFSSKASKEGDKSAYDARVVSPAINPGNGASCYSAWDSYCANPPDPGCGACWYFSLAQMTRTCKQ